MSGVLLLLLLVSLGALTASMSVHHTCALCRSEVRVVVGSLEPEPVLSFHVDAEKSTWVLC